MRKNTQGIHKAKSTSSALKIQNIKLNTFINLHNTFSKTKYVQNLKELPCYIYKLRRIGNTDCILL